MFFGLFETQTCSSMASQSGTPGRLNTASGLSLVIGILTPGVLTPGRFGRGLAAGAGGGVGLAAGHEKPGKCREDDAEAEQ